jgi:hypothetical protein
MGRLLTLLPSGVVMPQKNLLIVSALGAGEVSGAPCRVGGDDSGLIVVVDVAAFVALLTVGDHCAPLVHHDPACDLYRQPAPFKSFVYLLRTRFYRRLAENRYQLPSVYAPKITEQRGLPASRKPLMTS